MNRRVPAISLICLYLLALSASPTNTVTASPPPPLPNPKLVFTGTEVYETNGQKFVRYNLEVANWAVYPAQMFAAAPQLPPCGNNLSASRTWVDIYRDGGARLYGFCGLNNNQDLKNLWFSVKVGEQPPHCAHIVMTDRATNKAYTSNRVCFPKPALKADLRIKEFLFPPSSDKHLRVQVVNDGTVAAGQSVLRLTVRKIDGVPVGRTTTVTVPPIPPGGHQWVVVDATSILPKAVALKSTTFKLNADATTLINESNESNNEVWHNL